MSSARLLPLDPALPQLPLALDAAEMARVFSSVLLEQEVGIELLGCEVDRIKYRPRRNVAVSYRLQLADRERGGTREQLVAARFCGRGEGAARHARNLARASQPTAAGPRSTWIEPLEMVASWWPNDPKLGHSAAVLGGSDAQRDGVVRDVVAALTSGQGELVSHSVELAQVVPEHRACARVVLSYVAARAAPVRQCTLYAKTDAERRGAITHAVMRTLSASPAQLEGGLVTPTSLLWHSETGLQWQCALPGRALLDQVPHLVPGVSAQVGVLVAALHATPVSVPRCVTPHDLRERLRSVADTLVLVEPRWQAPVQGLAGVLTEQITSFPGAPDVTLHGDLHPRNILVDRGRMSLIDLDSVRRGPALLDLGDWVADAMYRAMLEDGDAGRAVRSCRAFVTAYCASVRHPVQERWLAWSTANSLLSQRAWRAVVNLKVGRYPLVEPLLRLALAIAESGSIDAAEHVTHRQAA
jgi:Phosphotransferase enzyme family